MPILYCCFCLEQFNNAIGLGNHQWRCVPTENNDVDLLRNTTIVQQGENNVVNCNVLEDNDNLVMLGENYDSADDYDVNEIAIAVADKYDTIDLLDEECDESSVDSNEDMCVDHDIDHDQHPVNNASIMDTISSTSLLEYKSFTETKKAKGSLSPSMVAAIELLSLLRTSGCTFRKLEPPENGTKLHVAFYGLKFSLNVRPGSTPDHGIF